MDFQKRILILSVGILLLCQASEGLNCYDCVSIKSGDNLIGGYEGCGDSFNQDRIPTLPCNAGVCSKTRVDLRGVLTVTRTCLLVDCQETDNLKCCNTELCNTAPLGAGRLSLATLLSACLTACLVSRLSSLTMA